MPAGLTCSSCILWYPNGRRILSSRRKVSTQRSEHHCDDASPPPPPRFRPPSVMGEQKYEHTQNITLQRILQAVVNLQSIHQDMDAADTQQVGCVDSEIAP